MTSFPSQARRTSYLIIYLAFLALANRIGFAQWLPEQGERGLWFVAGASALLLGNLLITPFFTSPANAIAYATTVLSSVAILGPPEPAQWQTILHISFVAFLSIVIVFGLIAIYCRTGSAATAPLISRAFKLLVDGMAQPRVLFSVVLVYSILQFHLASPRESVVLAVVALVISAGRPIETIDRTILRIRTFWKQEAEFASVGELVARQLPGMLLFRQSPDHRVPRGRLLLVADEAKGPRLAMALDPIGRDHGLLVRALEIPSRPEDQPAIDLLASTLDDRVINLVPPSLSRWYEENVPIIQRIDEAVGVVAPLTSVSKLYFELLAERALEVGVLVQVSVQGEPVLYQVTECTVREENVQGHNLFSFLRAEARKVGRWIKEERKYEHVGWLPQPNEPVFLASEIEETSDPSMIGRFPGTNYSVALKSVHDLVTHNTAILGILGIGKTFLALELVERILASRIKVVCLDLTDEYSRELSAYYDSEGERERLEVLRQTAMDNRDALDEDPDMGGSLPALKNAILADLVEFLADDDQLLKVYNPATLAATKQVRELSTVKDGGEWKRVAAVWEVSPVEITRVVAETILELVSDEFRRYAHVCLVLEEAHALVPEWNTVADERDRVATAGTARAIMQGRKYGFGCLVVSQRTANVTKTVLNQCNSICAMRSFDDTGKQFLANYIGSDYANGLPEIRERHAVVFGRFSTCDDPILLRLNDREAFLREFRSEYPPPERWKPSAEEAEVLPASAESFDPGDDGEE